jgi:hypothetical protein
MPADKLGRYMTSPEFLACANEAIKVATDDLLAQGLKPVYRDRSTGQIVGGGVDIDIEDRAIRDVLSEVLRFERRELRQRVVALGKEEGGPRLLDDAVRAIASGLLLAKTAMPHEDAKFRQVIDEQMQRVRSHAVLVELGHLMIEAELSTEDDAFRDRNVISDALFQQRIEVIKQALRHSKRC